MHGSFRQYIKAKDKDKGCITHKHIHIPASLYMHELPIRTPVKKEQSSSCSSEPRHDSALMTNGRLPFVPEPLMPPKDPEEAWAATRSAPMPSCLHATWAYWAP